MECSSPRERKGIVFDSLLTGAFFVQASAEFLRLFRAYGLAVIAALCLLGPMVLAAILGI